jgi:hypothetical protein
METLYALVVPISPLPQALATTNLLLSLWLYSGHFMYKGSYNMWPFVSGFFHLP